MVKDDRPIDSLKRSTAATIAAIAVAAILVVLAYVQRFAVGPGISTSPNSSDWANFGDYVGGTLGALFGFFAFAGVLITIFLQRRQLHHEQAKAEIEEIQRLLSSVSLVIDSILNESIQQDFPVNRIQLLNQSFTTLLAAAAVLPFSNMDPAEKTRLASAQRAAAENLTYKLLMQMTQLSWCLDEYKQHGGSSSVINFYVRRYAPSLNALGTLGFLEQYGALREQFRIAEYQASFAKNASTP